MVYYSKDTRDSTGGATRFHPQGGIHMTNAEIIQNVINYIKDYAEKKDIRQRGIRELCHAKGINIAQKTIDNMYKRPSSTTISTLLKVCDGLDLNLSAIFHIIENMKTEGENKATRFRYSIHEEAFARYPGDYHIFFLSTTPNTEPKLDHGILHLGDLHSNGECTASLKINTGDVDDSGNPGIKYFEGRLTYSTTGIMFCSLACSRYGDMWLLTIPHVKLNIRALSCTMGCATTSCSGPTAYPAIHRFCFCNKDEYPDISPETQEEIKGIPRMHNQTLYIKKEELEAYLDSKDVNSKLIRHMRHYLEIAGMYYAIPKRTFEDDTDSITFSRTMAELAAKSAMETCMHILPGDTAQLRNILEKDRKAKSLANAVSTEET